MDVNKVNDLITWLAKNGDKETMKQLSALIFEVSKFGGKSVVKEEKKEIVKKQSLSEHASSIQDLS